VVKQAAAVFASRLLLLGLGAVIVKRRQLIPIIVKIAEKLYVILTGMVWIPAFAGMTRSVNWQ